MGCVQLQELDEMKRRLKEMEEEEERKRGQPLDDSIEILLDSCPEYVK